MALTHLDLAALRRWLVTARADIAAYEHELNGLNVFPVPDGDTGTNLLVTMDGALARVTGDPAVDLPHAAEQLAHAMLVAARGNSGLILSQLARGVYEVVGEAAAAGAVPDEGAERTAEPLSDGAVGAPEVAEMMRVSKMTVYRLVHNGDLPAHRVGRSFRVTEDDVNEFLRKSFYHAG